MEQRVRVVSLFSRNKGDDMWKLEIILLIFPALLTAPTVKINDVWIPLKVLVGEGWRAKEF
jgi:hypothetical protein